MNLRMDIIKGTFDKQNSKLIADSNTVADLVRKWI
jgi:hypothetical protein